MVRPNELSFARRGALNKLAARRQGARPSQLTAVLVGVDPEDDSRAIVSFDGAEVSVLAGPVKMIPGALCAVEVDSANAPVRVLGPVTTRPEGLDEDVPAPDAVMPMPELGPRELTEAEAQAIQDTANGLAETQGRVSVAEGLLHDIGASDGPDGVADAISSYLAIPLDQITVVDNRGADGNVVANLYDAIIVEGLLTASGVITENLIATGAVESRHLNVVPDEGTGGLALDAYGMDVVGPDTGEAATFVSFRADQANAISFVQDGASTFSVSPEGDVVAQSVAANESLTYRGVELAGLLGQLPQGVVSDQVAYMNTFMQLDSVERTALLCTVPARDPGLGDRLYKVHVQISSDYSGDTIGLRVRYTEDGTQVKTTSPALERVIIKDDSGIYTFDLFHSASASKELHFRLGLWSSAGVRLPSEGFATHMWVEDLGPAVPVRAFTPSQGSGGGQTPTPDPTTETSTYVREFSPTWTRSFLGNGSFYNYGAGRAYHGQYERLPSNGRLSSLVGFNRTEINAFIGTGEVTKVEIYVKNSHSHENSGMTMYFGQTGHTSAPSSVSDSTLPVGNVSERFKKGEGKWITLPSSMWAAWKTGAANALGFKPPSTAANLYGFADGGATRVRIAVRK